MFCPLTGKQCDLPKTIHANNGSLNQSCICQNCVSLLETKPAVPPVFALFAAILKDVQEKKEEEDKSLLIPCPACGFTLQEFTKTGKIGCPACYEFFKEKLTPMLAKIHENKHKHVGKVPTKKVDPNAKIWQSISVLEGKLAQAIKEERYEDAAKITEQIGILKTKTS